MQQFFIGRDFKGISQTDVDCLRGFSDTIFSLSFAASGTKSVTVPASAAVVFIKSTADFYFNVNQASIAVPTGDSTTPGTAAPELAPRLAALMVNPGDVIRIATSSAAILSLTFYGY